MYSHFKTHTGSIWKVFASTVSKCLFKQKLMKIGISKQSLHKTMSLNAVCYSLVIWRTLLCASSPWLSNMSQANHAMLALNKVYIRWELEQCQHRDGLSPTFCFVFTVFTCTLMMSQFPSDPSVNIETRIVTQLFVYLSF